MVGRLVEQQDIRVAKERFRQQHLHLLAAVQIFHNGIVDIRVDAQTIQHLRRVGFRLPAVHLGELTLKLAGTDAVLVREILLGIDRILFLHDLVQTGISHDHDIHDRVLVILEVILLQHGKALPRSDRDISLCRLKLSRQDL